MPACSRKQLGLAGAALLIGIGAAWYGHHWWTVGRFIESTDDAYVGGDVTVIAPEGRRLHRRGRGHRQPGGPRRRSAGEAGRSRLPRRAGEGRRRGRRPAGDAGESRGQPAAAGSDDRAGAGRADRDRGRDHPHAGTTSIAIAAWRRISSALDAALSAGGRRLPEGARRRRQGARGAGGGTAPARRHRHAEAADAQRRWPARSPTATPRSSTSATPNCARRSTARSAIAARGPAPTPRSARSSSRWCRRTGSGWMRTSRKASSRTCARACR